MHRTLLLSQLETHRPHDDLEKEHHRRMVAFVRAHANCFDRALAEGHITGSAWIVNRERTAALLVHHKKLNRWLQPGGHADGDADPLRVAWREAREETGLQSLRPLADAIFDVDIHEIPTRGETPAHLHYDVRYCFEADAAEPFVVSEESLALAWRPLDQIIQEDEESLARMARKTQSSHMMKESRNS